MLWYSRAILQGLWGDTAFSLKVQKLLDFITPLELPSE